MADLNITEVSTRTAYTVGSSAQTTFTIPFPFFKTEDITVFVDGGTKAETADYTITGIDAEDGGFISGTLTMTASVTNAVVTIVRNIKKERTTDFPPSGGFNIRELNKQLDQIVAIQQDLQRQIDQKIGFPDTDFDGDNVNITDSAAARANKYLGFDSQGKGILAKDGSTTGTATTVDASKVPTSRKIDTALGQLTGGGRLDIDRTFGLATKTFTQGSAGVQYTNANIIVDQFGRIESISSGTGGSGGAGGAVEPISPLTGGGPIDGSTINIRLGTVTGVEGIYKNPQSVQIDAYGRIISVQAGNENDVSATTIVRGVGALNGGGSLATSPQEIDMDVLHSAGQGIGVIPTPPTVFSNPNVTIDQYGRVTNITAGNTNVGIKVAVVGNGAAYDPNDNSTLITNALATLTSATYTDQDNGSVTRNIGGVLYFPPGLCRTSSRILLPAGVPIVVMGAGIGQTFVRFTGSAGGFQFTMSGTTAVQGSQVDGQEVMVQDMTIQTTQQGGTNNIALQFNNQFVAGVVDPSVIVNRVHIQGATQTAFWKIGIDLDNCPQTKIHQVLIDGQRTPAGGTQSVGTDSGVQITSPNQATEYHITDCNIFFCTYGVSIEDPQGADAEGMYMSNCGLVANEHGVFSSNPNGFLSAQITNSHFSNRSGNITGKYAQLIVQGNNFYNRLDSGILGNPASVMIGLATSGTVAENTSYVITNNFFVSLTPNNFLATQNTYQGGIAIAIGDPNTAQTITGVVISNNFFQWAGEGHCILIRNSVRNHTLTGNRFSLIQSVPQHTVSLPGGGSVTHSAQTSNMTELFKSEASLGPNSSNVANPASLSGRRAMMYTSSQNQNLYDYHAQSAQNNLPNNTIHVGSGFTKAYDTDNFTGTGANGTGRLTIPLDGSVSWVKVGADCLLTQLSNPQTQVGEAGIRIVHFNAAGVAYQASTDFASSWATYTANGNSWGGVATDAAASQVGGQSCGANAVSGLVKVFGGDYFECRFANITGAQMNIEAGAQMWLEVIEGI